MKEALNIVAIEALYSNEEVLKQVIRKLIIRS